MTKLVCGIVGGMLVFIGAGAAQRIELPAGPNRDIVSRECQACHDLGMVVASAGLTREGWSSILAEMTAYGLNVTPDDQGKILDYLSTSLGPR
jgi:hypothetical protein